MRRVLGAVAAAVPFAAVTLLARVPGSPVGFSWWLTGGVFAAMTLAGLALVRPRWAAVPV